MPQSLLYPRSYAAFRLAVAGLDQTQGIGQYDAERWREHVGEHLQRLDMQAVRNDVVPFLERVQDAELLNRDNLKGLLA